MNDDNLKKILSSVDDLLKKTDISGVTSESAGFDELPDGNYLCEVVESKLTESKSSGNPMVSFRFKTVEDGYDVNDEGDLVRIPKTNNKPFFMHFVLGDEKQLKRFVADMLKFEGSKPGEPLLPKEAFTSSVYLVSALEILKSQRIYVAVTSTKDESGKRTSIWQNLLSWKRAAGLGLPTE